MSLKNLFGWLTKRTAKTYKAAKLKNRVLPRLAQLEADRKSTRLNSSHG